MKHIKQTYPLQNSPKTEVTRAIKNLKPNKAPGYDLITGTILKELPQEGTTYLTYLYNAVLRTGFFPPQWKVAQITMILKPGKAADDPKSYRPISLLSIPAKPLESLFLSRLLPIIEKKRLIPKHQFSEENIVQ